MRTKIKSLRQRRIRLGRKMSNLPVGKAGVKCQMYNGFTIIELLVVSGIMVIISLAMTDVFFTLLKKSVQTTVINEAKENGDYAIFVMERMIRNSASITTTCDGSAATSLGIASQDNLTTTFDCRPDPVSGVMKIASSSAISSTRYLTSDKIAVESCSFTCNQPDNKSSPAVVRVKFQVHQLNSPGVTFRPEDRVSINFETSVVARNTAQ